MMLMSPQDYTPTTAPRPDALIPLGNVGILFADLSGYSQLVYQCVNDETRLKKLGTAVYRLFHDAACSMPNVHIEGYAGDGFFSPFNRR